jgi:hypothetical protein
MRATFFPRKKTGWLFLAPWAATILVAGGETIPGVGVNLAVADFQVEEYAESFPTIEYRGERVGDTLSIRPRLTYVHDSGKKLDYLQEISSGSTIRPICFGWVEYNIGFPELDVRVINNSRQAIHIARVDLEVKESLPQNTPLPFLLGGYDQLHHIVFFNDGWQRVEKVEFEFDFVRENPSRLPPRDLPFRRTLHRVEKSAELHLREDLLQKGIPRRFMELCDEFEKLRKEADKIYDRKGRDGSLREPDRQRLEQIYAKTADMWPAFSAILEDEGSGFAVQNGECWLHGWMKIHWKEGGEMQSMVHPVACPVLLIPPDGLGAPGPDSGQYDVMLRPRGRNYTLQVPVSQVAPAGGITRFKMALGVPRTGEHELLVRLVTTDGTRITGGNVRLSALLPPSAVEELVGLQRRIGD